MSYNVLASYQITALERYGNTIVPTNLDPKLLDADLRALGIHHYQLRDFVEPAVADGRHQILEDLERKTKVWKQTP